MQKDEILARFKGTMKEFLGKLRNWECAGDIENAYLYGSFAKGCATGRSDIDICIVVRDGVSPGQMRRFRMDCLDIDGFDLDIHFRTTTRFAENTLYNNNVKQEGKSIWRAR